MHERNVVYTYELNGLQTEARFNNATGQGILYSYDGFGRMVSETNTIDGYNLAISSQYDANGNRTRMTYNDGGHINYTYDGLNRFANASWTNPANGNVVPFAGASYNQRGLVSGLGVASSVTNHTHDNAGRLNGLSFDFTGTTNDVSWTFTRNPASQILSETQDNDDYSWDGHVDVTRSYAVNGLNQYTGVGSDAYCYDANGNLTADGSHVYLYDVENRLVHKRVQVNSDCAALAYTGSHVAQLRYDPMGRLYWLRDYTGGSGIKRFVHDGNALIMEYNSNASQILRRYAHGPNPAADDPIAWWEGSAMDCVGTRFLHADPRGSIVALADCWGARQVVNTYDEYGIPDSATGFDIATKGRFRYTGQVWLPELGMHYYKARIYSPTLGRFMQTDPIGYEDQFNLYAYVGNDPINAVDPSGMLSCYIQTYPREGSGSIRDTSADSEGDGAIVVTAEREVETGRVCWFDRDDLKDPEGVFAKWLDNKPNLLCITPELAAEVGEN